MTFCQCVPHIFCAFLCCCCCFTSETFKGINCSDITATAKKNWLRDKWQNYTISQLKIVFVFLLQVLETCRDDEWHIQLLWPKETRNKFLNLFLPMESIIIASAYSCLPKISVPSFVSDWGTVFLNHASFFERWWIDWIEDLKNAF